jgi:hypothetical protein
MPNSFQCLSIETGGTESGLSADDMELNRM